MWVNKGEGSWGAVTLKAKEHNTTQHNTRTRDSDAGFHITGTRTKKHYTPHTRPMSWLGQGLVFCVWLE